MFSATMRIAESPSRKDLRALIISTSSALDLFCTEKLSTFSFVSLLAPKFTAKDNLPFNSSS
jgi:hypothetical protein